MTVVLSALAMPSLLYSAAGVQEKEPRTLFVAPFSAEAGANMAAEITARVRASLSATEGIEVGDWEAAVDRFSRARNLEAGALEPWDCVRARQVAAVQQIELLVCGVVRTTPDGFRAELQIVDLSHGASIDLDPGVARDQDGLVDHMCDEVVEWYRQSGG